MSQILLSVLVNTTLRLSAFDTAEGLDNYLYLRPVIGEINSMELPGLQSWIAEQVIEATNTSYNKYNTDKVREIHINATHSLLIIN